MAILRIRLYPEAVLRTPSVVVEQFDGELATLVADMVETMHAAPGIGLAAPQVGVSLRVAVVDLESGGDKDPEIIILVNPEISDSSGREAEVEGCLSIPDFTEKVVRPPTIRVRAQGMTGESFELAAEGLLARAIQHEIDHLDGILFIDRLKGLRRERGKRHLRRLAESSSQYLGDERPL